MKNNDTFNQILNSNLASIDPGFGQFALAKASADLMKKGPQQVRPSSRKASRTASGHLFETDPREAEGTAAANAAASILFFPIF